ncbi:MAG: patatin-like phospholipase family protein [Clostridia bacterium]|nr:patatin-like phospholipase family protein [Clostridia bacterium]
MNIIQSLKGLFVKRSPKKKLLGVALGSGGAKGMAHLGALKAFEEENITFNCFAGTSIGSIVGGLCAYGYTTDELKEVVLNICLKQYVRYLRPYMDMTFIEDVLNEYLKEATFSSLSLPFYAWATDKQSMQGVLLQSGKVARACTASSAVPPYFHSVDIDGKELIDGAYTNSIPADVLRERGADFILGIDLNAGVRNENDRYARNVITRILSDTLDSTVKITTAKDATERGYRACDVMLQPSLAIYTPLDGGRLSLEEMYEIGYITAREQMSFVKEKLREVLHRA